MNMSIFDNVQTEEFLTILRNFRISIDITGTIMTTGLVKYLRMMLRGKRIREFGELSLQGNTTNNHLKYIMEGLFE